MTEPSASMVPLEVDQPIWGRFFTVAPLVLVGTREGGGGYDLAPKHMVAPLGWQNYYAFVCSPRHATYHNAQATGEFTVSYPSPNQLLPTSFAASGRDEDGRKPGLQVLETEPARVVDGVLVRDAYLWLECKLERVIDGFADNSLITGRIVAAAVDARALRSGEVDDADVVDAAPLMAYLAPGRFAAVAESFAFPFPADFKL